MTVITISRQFGSGGNDIASRVCEALGYRQFDKRQIELAAKEAGLSDQEAVDYSEDSYKIRSFLDRLFDRSRPVVTSRIWKENPAGTRIVEESSMKEESAVRLVQNAVHSAYREGNMVIVGRGGQVILKDELDVLHVRIEAPIEERIQRVKQILKQERQEFYANIDIRRDAQDWIEEKDAISQDYIQRFYNVDWNDVLLYHMILNTGKLSTEQASQIIIDCVFEIHPEMRSQEQLAYAV